MSDEVRVVNETTGGEKGQKLERFDLIPARPHAIVARHYGIGARKYEDRNWERGYDWSLSIGALERHFNAFKQGEDIDEETGSPHLAAVVFHALGLLEFMETHPELDDRVKRQFFDFSEVLTWAGEVARVIQTPAPEGELPPPRASLIPAECFQVNTEGETTVPEAGQGPIVIGGPVDDEPRWEVGDELHVIDYHELPAGSVIRWPRSSQWFSVKQADGSWLDGDDSEHPDDSSSFMPGWILEHLPA